jgi:hypothetical protein
MKSKNKNWDWLFKEIKMIFTGNNQLNLNIKLIQIIFEKYDFKIELTKRS